SGKTVLAAHIIGRLRRPTLFFVHTRDLLYQTRNMLEGVLGIPIGQIGDGTVDIRDVTVGTIQTCSRALGLSQARDAEGESSDSELEEESPGEEPELLPERVEQITQLLRTVSVAIFDECHHIPAETSYLLALNLPKAVFRFGLSATPYRSDRQDMLIEAALGERLISINASYLIERQHLVPPHITFFVMQGGEGNQGRTYHEVYQREIVENDKRNQFAAEIARKFLSQNKTVLILVGQIKHGARLASLLPEAVFLTGRDSSTVRNEALDGLRDRTKPLIIATTLADEGLDIPSLDVLILAGGGRSETRALQRIGRALRPAKDKTKAYIVDFFDEARFLSEHSKSRIEIYETERYFQMEMINPWTGKNLSLEEFSSGSSRTPQQTSLLPDTPKKRRARRPQPSL
ncbi:MAG TPA: DEAD/DEAH box helicase, partial [bacterium]|nr:DEAD/DEAH box helicase [bacterium]